MSIVRQAVLLLATALMLSAVPTDALAARQEAQPNADPAPSEETPGRVLVAGATGAIGRHVVQDLLARGHHVRGLTRRPEAAREKVPEVEWVGGDLRERESLAAVVEDIDCIIYAAGSKSWEDPTNTSELIDYGGVRHLAELGAQAGVTRMVMISSAWVTRKDARVSERLKSVLAWKKKGEDSLRASGLEFTILRPLGMGTGPKGQMGIALFQGDRIESSVYIEREDLAAVAAECAFHPDARNKTFELFNAATMRIDSWKKDLAKMRPDPEPVDASQAR